MDVFLRLAIGSCFGLLAAADLDAGTVAGIVIFAVGIVIGLVSTFVTDALIRRRERAAWEQAGRPERRSDS
jgi:hypothetical protein